MPTNHREILKKIRTFPSLIKYLRDELDWPISSSDFEKLTYDHTPEELGIDSKNAAKIQEIKRLRPLSVNQPWGIFFVKFEPKRLPVVALRRILNRVVVKNRASANSAKRAAWEMDDLLFVSNYGEGKERRINLAHFTHDKHSNLPTLKVLGWDYLDTPLHLDHVADVLNEKLTWPEDEGELDLWRETWRSAFKLRHREVITTSKALAIKLAEVARGIRNRINAVLAIETEEGSVTKLMKGFQEALIHDLDEDGFADMYAQTIAYGLLSARIAYPGGDTTDDGAIQLPVTNPFLKELMETFLDVGRKKGPTGSGMDIDFDELGVSEVVELLDDANMEAVLRDFGDRNPQEDPVIHFYEHFLSVYDKRQKVQRGVFYTPRPVVSYIVRSVDELLRTEFNLEDGLADTTTWREMAEHHERLMIPEGTPADQAFVQILDPATGTGTFLVEVIDLIHKTMVEKWKAEGHGGKKIERLWNDYVPKHLLPRLHGYELLMAPYAIAHLKIGLKLYETGYRFDSEERARVYLTNSLEPPSNVGQMQLEGILPALASEAQSVDEIKSMQRFTVVIGNPPYSLLSANLSEGHRAIVESYKFVGSERIRERGALQFEKNIQDDYVKFLRISELAIRESGSGILGLITNHAFLDNLTFRGLRWSLLETFDRLRLLNLHGNAKRGLEAGDQNVFDIQQGVSISLLSRNTALRSEGVGVSYQDRLGTRADKYKWLVKSSSATGNWMPVEAAPPGFFFLPLGDSHPEYEAAPSIAEVFQQYSAGIVTARDRLVIDLDRSALLSRIESFARSPLSDDELLEKFAVSKKKGWDVTRARASLRSVSSISQCIHPVAYRPLDKRWIFYHTSLVWGQALPTFRHVLGHDNLALMTTRKVEAGSFAHVIVVDGLAEWHSVSMKDVNFVFPLWLYEGSGKLDLGEDGASNLITTFERAIQAQIGSAPPKALFFYIYGLLHSPTYRGRYAGFLKLDFPRVLLPGTSSFFRDLNRLGGDLIILHLMESPKLDDLITTYDGPKNPVVGRVGWSDGIVWLDAGKTKAREGHRATEPGTMGFRGIPEDVWDFHIGGYQVCHKWLKDRKGRTLTEDDLNHYQKIVVAINETIRIMREIDEVIEEHGGWPDAFSVPEEQ